MITLINEGKGNCVQFGHLDTDFFEWGNKLWLTKIHHSHFQIEEGDSSENTGNAIRLSNCDVREFYNDDLILPVKNVNIKYNCICNENNMEKIKELNND